MSESMMANNFLVNSIGNRAPQANRYGPLQALTTQ
jgi:hypothetical protein